MPCQVQYWFDCYCCDSCSMRCGDSPRPLWETTDILFLTGKMLVQACPLRRGAASSGEHRLSFRPCSVAMHQSRSSLALSSHQQSGPWTKSLVSSSITRFTSRFQTVPLLVHEMLLFFPRERRWSNRKPSRLVSIYATFSSNFLKMRFFPCTPHPPYRGNTKEGKWRNRLSFLSSFTSIVFLTGRDKHVDIS